MKKVQIPKEAWVKEKTGLGCSHTTVYQLNELDEATVLFEYETLAPPRVTPPPSTN